MRTLRLAVTALLATAALAGCAPEEEELTQQTEDELGLDTLASIADGCYQRGDMSCVWNAYWVLATGGKLKGMRLASSNLQDFLHCRYSSTGKAPNGDARPTTKDLSREPVLAPRIDAFVQKDWVPYLEGTLVPWAKSAGLTEDDTFDVDGAWLAQQGLDKWYLLASYGKIEGSAAQGDDLWYALGKFSARVKRIHATLGEPRADGSVPLTGYEVDVEIRDVYDFEGGGAPEDGLRDLGGTRTGEDGRTEACDGQWRDESGRVICQGGFKHAWARALVAAGKACNYDVGGVVTVRLHP